MYQNPIYRPISTMFTDFGTPPNVFSAFRNQKKKSIILRLEIDFTITWAYNFS